jgi:hypothetical protein
VVLHVRLPRGLRVTSLVAAAGAVLRADGSAIEWPNLSGTVRFEAAVGS